uniref:C-type lectin domain-containing protein n=1 Tax=Haplochromis burtoni TaxID=8153 RepID=A0A3Q2VNC9_HAPBU
MSVCIFLAVHLIQCIKLCPKDSTLFQSLFDWVSTSSAGEGYHDGFKICDHKIFLIELTHKRHYTDFAQSYCRAHHTDLASVRNMSENQRVTEVVPAGQSAWIGLFRDSWKWTDGSNSTFRNWNPTQPDLSTGSKVCAAILFPSGVWEDWNCDRKTAFICYRGKLHFVTFHQ